MGWFEQRFQEMPSRRRFDCVHCARSMWFPPSKYGKYRTCSPACAEAERERGRSDRARLCLTCGDRFVPRPRQLAAGHGQYCSQACNASARRALHAPEARAKAAETMKRLRMEGKVNMATGSRNPRWQADRNALRARRLAEVAQYKRDNRDRVRIWAANRRARGGGRADPRVVADLLAWQRGKCAACGVLLGEGFHLDHIVPLARGGGGERGNLQLLCARCNLQKGAKDPVAFMQSRGRLI